MNKNKITTSTMTKRIRDAALKMGLVVEYTYSKTSKSRYLIIYNKDFRVTRIRISDHPPSISNILQFEKSEFEVGSYANANGTHIDAINYLQDKYFSVNSFE